jgi:DNA repair photolyase
VLARVREMRDGHAYEADFATRMKGHGVWADLLRQRFEKTCARLGYGDKATPLDMSQFRPAALAGQGRLF